MKDRNTCGASVGETYSPTFGTWLTRIGTRTLHIVSQHYTIY